MKFEKKFRFDYEAHGISEENGYIKWYDWKTVRKPVRIIGFAAIAAIFVLSRAFKEELNAYGKPTAVLAALAALTVLLLVVIPLHEILHLLVMSKGKLDGNCIITYGQGAVSAVYTAELTRGCQLASLICPFIVFAVVFSAAALAVSGAVRLFFVYLLMMSSLSSYTDILMFFYMLKKVGKGDTVFGPYKKPANLNKE